MIKKEWKNLLSSKFLTIALIAILAIPTLYSTLFLSSMWDPYGKVNELPVAVVNNDVPVDYNEKELNIGKNLVDNLKENDSLSFNFVDADTAATGLENGDYYMVITIPKNFSKNATTLLNDKPKKMVLKYATNPGKNYIASKMSETALSKIKESIEAEVTETYADTVFEQLATLGEGFESASNGATDLSDGLLQLQDGGVQISDGLSNLSKSMLTFTDGTTSLSNGIDTYLNGVESLNSGAKDLADGASQLSDGASALNSAVSQITIPNISLTDEQKSTIKNTASSSVSEYANSLSSGIGAAVSNNINNTLNSKDTVSKISGAVLSDSNIVQMVSALQASGYTKEQAESLVVGIISSTLSGVSSNITSESIANSVSPSVSSVMSSVASGAAESGAQAVVDEVNVQLSSYNELFDTLKSSTKSLAQGASSLSDGSSKLYDGSSTLVSNNSTLKNGISSISDGSNKISSGVNSLYNGSLSLTDGLKTANDGTSTLQSGLSDAAKTVNSTVSNIDDNTLDMFAAPVTSKETQITTVKDNGHAMAAYMMVVALWVGSMAFCTVYPLTEARGKVKSGFKLWLSKASVMYPTAIAFSLIMVTALHFINGFDPVDMGKTIFVACVAAVAFISIIYFFNAAFGLVGTFIALVLMIIQLSGSTGTYPAEISGAFVEKISKYLPFTHAVTAFRSTISGGTSIKGDMIFLFGVIIVMVILAIVFFEFKTRKQLNNQSKFEGKNAIVENTAVDKISV